MYGKATNLDALGKQGPFFFLVFIYIEGRKMAHTSCPDNEIKKEKRWGKTSSGWRYSPANFRTQGLCFIVSKAIRPPQNHWILLNTRETAA